MLRRLRGIFGTALTWGAAWSLVGLAVTPFPWFIIGAVGAVSGTIFALALSHAERRADSLDALSIHRTAACGAMGGLAVQMLVDLLMIVAAPPDLRHHILSLWHVQLLTMGGMLGAASAAGSLALARRAPKEPAQLSPADVDFAMSQREAIDAPGARS